MKARAVLARFLALSLSGKSLRAAEAELGVPKSTLGRWKKRHGIRGRQQSRLSPRKRKLVKQLLHKGWGGRRTAAKAQVSRDTVWQYQQVEAFRELGDRSRAPRPCKPWRCPGGGELLRVTICILHGCRKPPSKPRTVKPGTGETRRRSA